MAHVMSITWCPVAKPITWCPCGSRGALRCACRTHAWVGRNSDLAQILPRKRTRKASQLPQIEVYQNQTFETNSHELELSKKPTPAASGRTQEKIWPHIAVEIPFRLDIHMNPIGIASQRGSRVPLASLGSIAINGTPKAPKIPANWLKSQPNDHTSTFFSGFSSIFFRI